MAAKLARCPKLLPCPFCGGKAEFQSKPSPWLTAYWRVDCSECPENMVVFARGATKREATETWNRRAAKVEGKVVKRWSCGPLCTKRCDADQQYRIDNNCRRVRVVEEV